MKDNLFKKVVAIVVTHNRKELLIECLEAILSQSFPVYRLIIIDNASTDGTSDMLKEKEISTRENVVYKRLDTNIGGAGGFYTGLNFAQNLAGDWVWLMDDDTIPQSQRMREGNGRKGAELCERSFFD